MTDKLMALLAKADALPISIARLDAVMDAQRAAVDFCRTELPALIAERDALVKAVDALALALADNLHTWTPEQRALYESATKGCD